MVALRPWLESLWPNGVGLLRAPYSTLMIASDSAGWVLDEEAKEMIRLAEKLGFSAMSCPRPLGIVPQAVHYTSFFSLAGAGVFSGRHRVGVDYFHGKPDQDPAFAAVWGALKRNSQKIHRVRLSYSGMLPLALEAGVAPEKIHRIAIGLNPDWFSKRTPESNARVRQELGIPESALVVGSFQKDGQGWGDGLEPKGVKGPDILVRSLEILKAKHSNLWVLLTGPARGYVKQNLERLGIPYTHRFFEKYSEIGKFYQALDLYLVTSREEGGPKAILESMASGVPLVTTRVGQAVDIAKDEQNSLVCSGFSPEEVAEKAERVLGGSSLREKIVASGIVEAQNHTYDAQVPLWRKYFDGFVEGSHDR